MTSVLQLLNVQGNRPPPLKTEDVPQTPTYTTWDESDPHPESQDVQRHVVDVWNLRCHHLDVRPVVLDLGR